MSGIRSCAPRHALRGTLLPEQTWSGPFAEQARSNDWPSSASHRITSPTQRQLHVGELAWHLRLHPDFDFTAHGTNDLRAVTESRRAVRAVALEAVQVLHAPIMSADVPIRNSATASGFRSDARQAPGGGLTLAAVAATLRQLGV